MNGLDANLTLVRAGFRLDATLQAPAGQVTAIYGASGSGKTTLLRCLAGLEPAAGGRVQVGDQVWLDDAAAVRLPAHQRAAGYVFQDTRLFPHRTVRGNLDYAHRRRATGPGPEREDVVGVLDLAPLLDRYPHQLSGGEQQRAAIGRALVRRPRLLLLDEPMASLDPGRKGEILPYLETLHRALALPVLYVSHSVEEIYRLADRLALLRNGQLSGPEPLAAMLTHLDSPLALEAEASTVLEARVAGYDDRDRLSRLQLAGGELLLLGHAGTVGDTVRVVVHARDVSLALSAADDSSILNIVPATVRALGDDGRGRVAVRLTVGEHDLLAHVTRRSAERLQLVPGLPVFAQIKSVALAR